MIAIKANRQYTINETDVQSFAKEGYDVYDDKGNLTNDIYLSENSSGEQPLRLCAHILRNTSANCLSREQRFGTE